MLYFPCRAVNLALGLGNSQRRTGARDVQSPRLLSRLGLLDRGPCSFEEASLVLSRRCRSGATDGAARRASATPHPQASRSQPRYPCTPDPTGSDAYAPCSAPPPTQRPMSGRSDSAPKSRCCEPTSGDGRSRHEALCSCRSHARGLRSIPPGSSPPGNLGGEVLLATELVVDASRARLRAPTDVSHRRKPSSARQSTLRRPECEPFRPMTRLESDGNETLVNSKQVAVRWSAIIQPQVLARWIGSPEPRADPPAACYPARTPAHDRGARPRSRALGHAVSPPPCSATRGWHRSRCDRVLHRKETSGFAGAASPEGARLRD